MSRIVVFVMAAIVFAVALVSVGALFFRHSRSVTAAELLAEIPANMRIEDREYPEREKRFQALLALGEQVTKSEVDHVLWFPKAPADLSREASVEKKYGPLLTQLSGLLSAGPIQFPNGKRTATERAALLSLERAVAISAAEKVLHHDQPSAFRLANLGFGLARSLRLGGGRFADQSTARMTEWVALNGFWTLGYKRMLPEADLKVVLKKLPEDRGIDPELSAVLGRNLRQVTVPYLAHASQHRERLSTTSFDPIETARLYGRVYEQAADDAMDPSDWSWEHCEAMVAGIAKDLKGSTPHSASDWASNFTSGLKGNLAGRGMVGRSVVAKQIQLSRQLAAYRNMLRATLLLEAGKSPSLRDPLGHGELQVDPQRRIVWSVGMDGIDDGGRYVASSKYGNDLVLRY